MNGYQHESWNRNARSDFTDCQNFTSQSCRYVWFASLSKSSKDEFQDYDVVYIVDDFDNLTSDLSWLNQFGKRIIEQEVSLGNRRLHLMLFEDGNRIDLDSLP